MMTFGSNPTGRTAVQEYTSKEEYESSIPMLSDTPYSSMGEAAKQTLNNLNVGQKFSIRSVSYIEVKKLLSDKS